MLAAPATLDRLYDFSETSFDSVVDTMRASAPWIVLDVPHAWNGWTRRMLIGSDEVVVVAGPDLANLRNAKNIIDNIRGSRPNDYPPRLVINGVGMPKRPEISVADFAKTVEMEPVAVIPHDAKLFGAAANNGQMIAEIEAEGKNRRNLRRSRQRGRGPRRGAQSQARPARSVHRQVRPKEGLRAAHRDRTNVGARGRRPPPGGRRRREERACSVSVPIPD